VRHNKAIKYAPFGRPTLLTSRGLWWCYKVGVKKLPIRKWTIQYILILLSLFVVFASVQALKGQGLEYSIQFGALWSFIATSLYFARRIQNYRKSIHCALCNDLSVEIEKSGKNQNK
jgi:hypothetical protein